MSFTKKQLLPGEIIIICVHQHPVPLTRTSHRPSAAAVDPGMSTALHFLDPGMSTALHFLGLLDILSSMPAGPFVARLVSTPVCTASRRNTVRNAG